MTRRISMQGTPLHQIFHENSKNFEISKIKGEIPDEWKEIEYKSFDRPKRIVLPDDRKESNSHIDRLIEQRRSADEFEDNPISKKEVFDIILTSAGITYRGNTEDDHRRAYPSGGARYPLELYPIILSGDDIESGIYHFDVLEEHLSLLNQEIDENRLFDIIYDDHIESTPLLVVISGLFARATDKYGERGYRHVLIESGHLMQNICLTAQEQGLSCRPYSGFLDDEVDDILGLRAEETSIYAGLIGRPKSE